MAMSDEEFSKLIGISKAERERIWAEVKANSKRLDDCETPHEFVEYEQEPNFRKKRCTKCLGTLSAIDALWYERGLQHGRESK